MVNLLLVGAGAHARRIYLPISWRDGSHHGFRIAAAVDLERSREQLVAYFKAQNQQLPPLALVPDHESTTGFLSADFRRKLDDLSQTHQIHGVIIATDPLNHLQYAHWAIGRGLSVFVDKPLSTRRGVVSSVAQARALVEDYEGLMAAYARSQRRHSRVLCSVVVQRRFHPIYCRIRALIAEVFEQVSCPVTSIQSMHSDGQWRFPSEILNVDYHPFNQGYGKCSHSGYHFLDLAAWLLEAAESPSKRVDGVDVYTSVVRPLDFVAQLDANCYRLAFPGHTFSDGIFDLDAFEDQASLGEIDAFVSLAFRAGDRVMTLGSINLLHTGFSQRGWISSAGRDLYKGNGRVRHETHYIAQGPFQAIAVNSYQSKEIDPARSGEESSPGGEYHLDVQVFRNHKLRPEWKVYETFRAADICSPTLEGRARGHQEDAKRRALLEFVAFLKGDAVELQSDLASHARGVRLLSAVLASFADDRDGSKRALTVDYPAPIARTTDIDGESP